MDQTPDLSALDETPASPPPQSPPPEATAPVRNFDEGISPVVEKAVAAGVEFLAGLAEKSRAGRESQRAALVAEAEAREAAREAADEIRDQAAALLSGLTWTNLEGEELPVLWTAGRVAEYEALCEAAGVRSIPGQPLEAETLCRNIFLFLAVHPESEWEMPREVEHQGRVLRLPPLMGNRPRFLAWIRGWADEQFPPGDPGTVAREAAARSVFLTVMERTVLFRAEPVMTPEEEEELRRAEELPKTPAPLG